MPIYEYQCSEDNCCAFCKNGFEVLAKASSAPLESCPRCGAAVERKISAPHLARSAPSLAESNLEKHGFTQYRKLGKGVYEKTTGKGPDIITDD